MSRHINVVDNDELVSTAVVQDSDASDDSIFRASELMSVTEQSVDASDSDVDMDIDALLDAAAMALAKNKSSSSKSKVSTPSVTGSLITRHNGVAKLNPDVLMSQTSHQAEAQATEKVSNLETVTPGC